MLKDGAFTDEMRRDGAASVLCWLASVDAQGHPSVSPKEMFALTGAAQLVIADIASAGSVRNLRANPHACVSFIDVFRQRGWKMTGRMAVYGPQAPEFEALGAPVLERVGTAFRVRHLLVLDVAAALPILAPSYRFYPERSQADRDAAAYAAYGVTPVSEGDGAGVGPGDGPEDGAG